MPKVFTLRAIEYASTPGTLGTDRDGRPMVKTQAVHTTIPAGTVVEICDTLHDSLPEETVREATPAEVAAAAVENGGKLAKHVAGKGVSASPAPPPPPPVEDEEGEEGETGDDGEEGEEGEEGAQTSRASRRASRRRP